VSTCGANPGMVSWFVKQALVNLAKDTKLDVKEPGADDREGWARLMKKLGVKGVHIAERDTQRTKRPKPLNVFWNTWSVEGFISEGLQPAELGWGTHEKWMPKNAKIPQEGQQRPEFSLSSPAPTPASGHGARRPARNTACW
jgi:homospermidine synthase